MKFDPFSWKEVKTNAQIEVPKGRLQLRLSSPCPVYAIAQGVEALVGFSSEFDVEFAEAVTVEVNAPKGVRAFQHETESTSFVALGETFTNIDRMPHESGALQEVTRARRMFEFEKRQMIADIRREAAVARASLRPKPDKAAAEETPQHTATVTETEVKEAKADDVPKPTT